ncbi:MAG: O-antigen ligase family protein [bacterium]
MADSMKSLTAPAILLGCLCAGLPVGGLRAPLLWTSVAGLIWLTALASPAPTATSLKPWAWWLGWAFISMAACDQPLKSLYSFSHWLTLLAYFHVAGEHWTERDSRRWLPCLAFSALALGLGALMVQGKGHPMTGLMPPYYNYTVFVEAAFIAAAMGATGHRDSPRGAARWGLWGLMVFAMGLIIKARSRSGLLAVAVAAAFWMYRRGKTKWLAWGFLTLAAAVVLAPSDITAYLFKLDLSAWFKRPKIWAAALQVAADHPFLGEGLGNFEQGFLRHNFPAFWAANYGFSSAHAHNELLELAAVTGWVGLGLFLAALLKSLRPAGPQVATPGQEAGICAFVAMAAQCLVDNMLHMPALAMLFFTALICARSPAELTDRIRGAPMGSRTWRWLCVSGFILSIAAFFPQHLVSRAREMYGMETDPARRVAIMSRAIRIFPADYYLHETLARALIELRPPQPDRVLEHLALASRLNPTNALYPVMQAEIALRQGRQRDALKLINRGIKLEPNYLGARLLRAEIWISGSKKKEAGLELGEILRRRMLLQNLPTYSGYDRTIIYFDAKRFTAVSKSLRSHS